MGKIAGKNEIYDQIKGYKTQQAGAELGQAQLSTGIRLYCHLHLLLYIDLSKMTRHLVLLYLMSRPTFQLTPF